MSGGRRRGGRGVRWNETQEVWHIFSLDKEATRRVLLYVPSRKRRRRPWEDAAWGRDGDDACACPDSVEVEGEEVIVSVSGWS